MVRGSFSDIKNGCFQLFLPSGNGGRGGNSKKTPIPKTGAAGLKSRLAILCLRQCPCRIARARHAKRVLA